MKFILPAITLLLFSTSAGEHDCDLLTDTVTYWPAPTIEKPNYLDPITDSTFGTKITRITGNPGDAIPNLENVFWADEQLRHGTVIKV